MCCPAFLIVCINRAIIVVITKTGFMDEGVKAIILLHQTSYTSSPQG